MTQERPSGRRSAVSIAGRRAAGSPADDDRARGRPRTGLDRLRRAWRTALAVALAAAGAPAWAQGPTVGPAERPSSTLDRSLLGRPPGEGANPGALGPGAATEDNPISGGVGPRFPRVPQSVIAPGGPRPPGPVPSIGLPEPLSATELPLYGTLAVPAGAVEDGPPDGLTLDDAIRLALDRNLELRAKALEIPQARADVLTASLRNNPILYADTQLIPYGRFSRERPGGPTQYDLNLTFPLDVTGKRRARTEVACRAVHVLEAQFQDAARLTVANVQTAFVDVVAARQTVWYARASVSGLSQILRVTEELKDKGSRTQADVARVRILKDAAEIGLADAEETLHNARAVLAALINLPPDAAPDLEVRGGLRDSGPPPPPLDALRTLALRHRPDLQAFRLGIARAQADVRLAQANRLSDVFLLYQPYTFQDNAPFGLQSATSWAVGLTVPLPVFNRNQGNIERANWNHAQAHVELAAAERLVIAEVDRALREYQVTQRAVARIEGELLPTARQVRNDTYTLFVGGEKEIVEYLNAQREYNEVVRQYRDTLTRHRRSMLDLNTVIGLRLLP